MKQKFRSAIISKYLEIFEENIANGNYVDTDFRNYSELVQCVIHEMPPKDHPVFFTALCIPPFKWFNFHIEPKPLNVTSVKEVRKMEADPTWTSYIKFVSELAQKGTNVHRCIFSVADDFNGRSFFLDLVEESRINAQFRADIIVKKTDELNPLTSREITDILRRNGKNEYKCYENAKQAYLIVMHEDEINFDKEVYARKRLLDFFAVFQPPGQLKQWTYKPNLPLNKPLPEDFFLVGNGECPDKADWQFALAADVTQDLKKVRLWLISDDSPAQEKGVAGDYQERFSFFDLKAFVNNVIIRQMG